MKSIAALGLAVLFTSCSNDLEKVRELTTYDEERFPVETLRETELIYSDSAQVLVVLKAAQLDRYMGEEPYLEMDKGVRIQFLDKEGEVESQLTADYAIIQEEEERMEAKRAVKVRNSKGELLETEHLVWDQKTAKVYTEEFVKITTADEVILGEGLEATQDFSQYTIKKIKGSIAFTH